MSRFRYHGRSADDVHERAKQRSSRYDQTFSVTTTNYKVRSGENHIRILPWIEQKAEEESGYAKFRAYTTKYRNHWGIDVRMHYGVGPDEGQYLCLKDTGQPCPICDVWRAENIERLSPKDRVLVRLIDRKDEKAGIQYWMMPLSVSTDISAISEVRSRTSSQGKLLQIDDWDNGHDVYFDTEGADIHRKYKRFFVEPEPSYLLEDENAQDDILEELFAEPWLPDQLNYYSAEHLLKVLMGQKGDEDADSDEDAGSSRRGRSDERGRGRDREERVSSGRSDRGDGDSGRSSRRPRDEREDDGDRISRRQPDAERGSRREAAEDTVGSSRRARRDAELEQPSRRAASERPLRRDAEINGGYQAQEAKPWEDEEAEGSGDGAGSKQDASGVAEDAALRKEVEQLESDRKTEASPARSTRQQLRDNVGRGRRD
jgi:hypothetical protein